MRSNIAKDVMCALFQTKRCDKWSLGIHQLERKVSARITYKWSAMNDATAIACKLKLIERPTRSSEWRLTIPQRSMDSDSGTAGNTAVQSGREKEAAMWPHKSKPRRLRCSRQQVKWPARLVEACCLQYKPLITQVVPFVSGVSLSLSSVANASVPLHGSPLPVEASAAHAAGLPSCWHSSLPPTLQGAPPQGTVARWRCHWQW